MSILKVFYGFQIHEEDAKNLLFLYDEYDNMDDLEENEDLMAETGDRLITRIAKTEINNVKVFLTDISYSVNRKPESQILIVGVLMSTLSAQYSGAMECPHVMKNHCDTMKKLFESCGELKDFSEGLGIQLVSAQKGYDS